VPFVNRELLDEQIRYYRARAPEYDRWFHRVGRHDLGPEGNARWFAEIEEVRQALDAVGYVDEALELACGTGLWTTQLVSLGATVTAVDASPEMLDLNRMRVASANVTYVEADLFEWEPAQRYDLVFFGFWISHVPDQAFQAFWEKVARALKPGGRAFLVDDLRARFRSDNDDEDSRAETRVRHVDDGRSFRIFKIFYDPVTLTERLQHLGWSCDFRSAGFYLLYGSAGR
jgi:demethylmenaquinone methyltransferase/2-methoxy-6-polyprenyl-1,4-benzoquinol methylase